LVNFFQRSRDKWKEKCKAAKRQNKSLKLCLAKMKKSRDRWKAQAMARQEGAARAGSPKKTKPGRAGTPPHAICPP
jgi:hypothetical protein